MSYLSNVRQVLQVSEEEIFDGAELVLLGPHGNSYEVRHEVTVISVSGDQVELCYSNGATVTLPMTELTRGNSTNFFASELRWDQARRSIFR